jgi:hypothetical protein
MRIFKKPTARKLKLGFASLLLLLVAYASAYLALVERKPYVGGGNVRRLPAAVSFVEQRGQPISQKRLPLFVDGYSAAYALPWPAIATFFAPAHAIDRIVRPSFWPKFRTFC